MNILKNPTTVKSLAAQIIKACDSLFFASTFS